MLILHRRRMETIVVFADGREVARIALLDAVAGRAKFGILAPDDVLVLRYELTEAAGRTAAAEEAAAAQPLRRSLEPPRR